MKQRRQMVKNKQPEMSLIDQFQSRIVINIELPSPVKKFYKLYLSTMKLLTGEEKSTWEEFITGQKVSKLALKIKFSFCVLLYTSTIIIALQSPKLLPLFWTISYAILHYCRYQIFSYTKPRGTFFLIDYCYYSALLMMIMFNVPGLDKNPIVYATVFTLQTGSSLNSVIGMKGVNSLTFASTSSLSHMQLLYLHYVPSVVLFVDLLRKRSEEPWVFNEVTSRYSNGQTVLLNHFVFPGIALLLWATVYLILTEIIYYDKIYHSIPPYYTQTNYNLGYFRPRKNKGIQRLMQKFLRKFYLLRDSVSFRPERRYAHHLIAVALYNIGMFLVSICLMPLSLIFIKNIEIFGIYLLALFLVVVNNGSEKMVNERYIVKKPTLALKTRKKSIEVLSAYTTDTEELIEGNDEHWRKTTDQNMLRKKESKLEKPNDSSASGDNEISVEDVDELPVPVPLNSQSKAVDKEI